MLACIYVHMYILCVLDEYVPCYVVHMSCQPFVSTSRGGVNYSTVQVCTSLRVLYMSCVSGFLPCTSYMA